jgi:hypothetical protein
MVLRRKSDVRSAERTRREVGLKQDAWCLDV